MNENFLFVEDDETLTTDKPHCDGCSFEEKIEVTDKPHCDGCG